MASADEQTSGRRAVVGLLAHVDAGKTTLAESLLLAAGAIRSAGRVDHGDAHLDFESIERTRGITVFSKQARLTYDDLLVMLVDTPGHVDFSAEAERTLAVLDYAVLVVGANDGVRGHTRTLWQLLERYGVPTILFVNKCDLAGADAGQALAKLQQELDASCLPFQDLCDPEGQEACALADEAALDEYLRQGALAHQTVRRLVLERKVFPCLFGSALRHEGTRDLLDALSYLVSHRASPPEFGARVYKVSHGSKGERIAWLKVTGGVLRAKQEVSITLSTGEAWSQKVDQLRVYDGSRFRIASEVPAGEVCAVTGLDRAMPGDGLGCEGTHVGATVVPVIDYELVPTNCDAHALHEAVLVLTDEDPLLAASWDPDLQQVRLRLMGVVQQEIVQQELRERFGIEVTFGQGRVLHKETIAAPVQGIGHFEPLRHYAEVHLRLEPTPRGAGVTCATECSEDELARNWQRLILTHVMEREHRGVLTGAPLTDVRIVLTAGRAHAKHTEGGDFRQATYRAIRQGLMQAESVLLEPWYDFALIVPADRVGRACADLQRLSASFGSPVATGNVATIEGAGPVSTLRDYALQVRAYTQGEGTLSLAFGGYRPCHNADQVVQEAAYDPTADLQNPPHSVFCSHGAGYTVPWNEVAAHAHVSPF